MLIMKQVPAHRRQLVPVKNELEEFMVQYRALLPDSDVICIYRLIEQGKVSVCADLSDGATTLVTEEPNVQHYLDSVFAAVADEAEWEQQRKQSA